MTTPLVVILGPTASGKSCLSFHLAKTFCGEIVNCDSVQVYRYLDIGTSKPTRQEQFEISHHLLDVVEPDRLFTAGDYMIQGRTILAEIRRRGHLPILAGGSGLYLRALLKGLFNGPKRSEMLRDRLKRKALDKGAPHLHRVLCRVDPISGRKISPQDLPKIIRALEVFCLTSKPISWHFGSGRDPLQGFQILKIGLNPPRKSLYESIDGRVERMFSAGLVEEVQSILNRGFSEDAKALQSLGYSQVLQYLHGELNLAKTLDLTKRETRHYAKRQLTWFRKEEDVFWFEGFGTDPCVQANVQVKVQAFLETITPSGIGPQIQGIVGAQA